MAVAASSWAPCLPGVGSNLARALDELMWIVQVEYSGFSMNLEIRGYIRPPLDAVTERQMLTGYADRLEEILDVLDQADVELAGYPEVDIKQDRGFEMQVCLVILDCHTLT